MHCNKIFDLHCDTLTAFMSPTRCRNTLDDPEADFALCKIPRDVRWGQCFAIFVPDGLTEQESAGYYDFHQKNFARQLQLFAPRVALCRSAAEIEHAWAQGKVAALLTVENGAALAGDLERVSKLAQDGVRMITLTWNGENQLGSGSATDHPLSPFGKAVIPAMEAHDILIDVSHLNDHGLSQVLALAKKPFVASHSNARSVCPHSRNLTDEQICQLVDRDCLIGLNYYSPFLRSDGAQATLDDLFAHITHFLELGAQRCLALGSDFDGADLPPCLNCPEHVIGLQEYLLGRGLSPELCSDILFRNALNFFHRNLHDY